MSRRKRKEYTLGSRFSIYLGLGLPQEIADWVNIQSDVNEAIIKLIANQIHTNGITDTVPKKSILSIEDLVHDPRTIGDQVQENKAPKKKINEARITYHPEPEPVPVRKQIVQETSPLEEDEKHYAEVVYPAAADPSPTVLTESTGGQKWLGITDLEDDDLM